MRLSRSEAYLTAVVLLLIVVAGTLTVWTLDRSLEAKLLAAVLDLIVVAVVGGVWVLRSDYHRQVVRLGLQLADCHGEDEEDDR